MLYVSFQGEQGSLIDSAAGCRGNDAPHDAGSYNSAAWETGFFVSQGGNWDSDYGHFFLSWYSGLLLQHADRVLEVASEALNKRGRPCRLKRQRQVRVRTAGMERGANSRPRGPPAHHLTLLLFGSAAVAPEQWS